MMQPFHDLMADILANGEDVQNARTGETCRYVVGRTLKFDLSQGFPVPTTKAFAWKTMVAELLGFFRGYDNAAQFEADGCRIWRQNADETAAWLASPYREGPGHMGRAYPLQWTRMRDQRVATTPEEYGRLVSLGYVESLYDADRSAWLMEGTINQVERCLDQILVNPTSRQNLLSGWRPDELDMTCLPPCHLDYLWTPSVARETLDLSVTQRSWDVFLAFNIQTAALFLALMARLSGYKPGVLTLFAVNAHLYHNHFDVVREQISRPHFAPPQIEFGASIPEALSARHVQGVFERILASDIRLLNYKSHPALKAPMAV